jgi:hypothetical protein
MNQQPNSQQPQVVTGQWLQAVISVLVTVALLAVLVQKVIKELKGIREALKS